MAAIVSKVYRLLRSSHSPASNRFSRVYTVCSDTVGQRRSRRILSTCLGMLSGTVGVTCGILYFLNRTVKAMGPEIEVPSYPWEFERTFKSLDHSALRRGWQVYKAVCSTCHSLRYIRFMHLVNVTHTAEEVKAIAAEFEVDDGPDEEGNYFQRPAKLADFIPPPFPNEEAARAANMGANPPDLTFIIPARPNGLNYIFSLLTGWSEPPAGVSLLDGQYFNVYFPGGVTGMAQTIQDGIVEYEDGTPATQSQMAKDMVEFLNWTSGLEHDLRKVMSIKVLFTCSILFVTLFDMLRRKWSHIRSRQFAHIPK